MAKDNIFDMLRQRVEQDGTRTEHERRAMYWFASQRNTLSRWQQQTQTTTFTSLREQSFTKQLVPANRAMLGRLYFFRYDPISRDSLPYYDRFPLVMPLQVYGTTGFMGINFHYLSYYRRAQLFDALYSRYVVGAAGNPLRTQLRITYDILDGVSKYKAFRPALKRYDVKHIRTPLLQVGAQDWDIALFLPVEMFAKSSRTNVWRESEQEIY